MLTFKQRYKPRTTREYTKSDLTVYDSAGNIALNTLKVYGKSEVVDGAIKSAGDSGSISIRTEGKNSLKITATTQTINGITFTVNSNKTITVSGTATAQTKLNIGIYLLMGHTIRYLSGATVNGSIDTIRLGYSGYGFIQIANTALVLNREDTDTDWNNYVFIEVAEGYTANNVLFKPMISYSNDTTYEPYIGDTMAVFETGTPLYGVSDTVRDVMEWNGSSGKVTKNCDEVDLGTLTWIKGYRNNTDTGYIFYSYSLSSIVKQGSKIFATNLNYVTTPIPWEDLTNGQISITDTSTLIISYDANSTTDLITALTGEKIMYELATPTVTPLTQTENESIAGLRTFNGTTHFNNNATTDMTVDYTIRVPTIN